MSFLNCSLFELVLSKNMKKLEARGNLGKNNAMGKVTEE